MTPAADSTTSVSLVDDHEAIAIALDLALAGSPRLAFGSRADTVASLLHTTPNPELVVLDLRLADGSSPVQNVERLVGAGALVVVFTSGENPYLVRLAAKSAVLSIVRKSAPMSLLVETLERAAEGEPVMSTEWASAIDSDPEVGSADLSPAEQRVLELFATGLKAHSVAMTMSIAPSTVEDYVRRIRAKYAKTGRPAHTKIDLYKRAIEDGFLPLPESLRNPI